MASQHEGTQFPSARCSDTVPEDWILLLFFLLEIRGKRCLGTACCRSPCTVGVRGQQASQSGTSFPQAGVSSVALWTQGRFCTSQTHHLKMLLLLQLEAPPTRGIPFCPNSANTLHSGAVSPQPAPSTTISLHYGLANLEAGVSASPCGSAGRGCPAA